METQAARRRATRPRAQIGRRDRGAGRARGTRPGSLVGRSRDQAPEIDGVVRLRGEAAPGELVRARVTGADIYDLRAMTS